MNKTRKLIIFNIIVFCLMLTIPNRVYAKNTIVTKYTTIYQNKSFDIKTSSKVKQKKQSNKNIKVKKISNKKYRIYAKKPGKSTLKLTTNKKTYKYVITIKKHKNAQTLSTNKLTSYIHKKNPERIIFTNKTNKKAKTKLSSGNNNNIVGWMNKNSMYISNNKGTKVHCNNIRELFYDMKHVKYIDVSYLDTTGATNAEYMFANCKNLQTIKGLSKLNLSKVTSIEGMFAACDNLTELDVSNWDTSHVTSMDSVFYYCKKLTTIKGLETWNTARVKTMSSMFSYGISYSHDGPLKYIDLSTWNMSNVKDTSDMFYGCGHLENLDTSRWVFKNLETADHMFCQCISLQKLDVSNWWMGKCKDFNAIFHSLKQVKGLDVSKWNTSNALYFCQMFEDCQSLSSIDVTHFDTRKVIGFGEMFKDCTSLTELDLTSFTTSAIPNGKCIQGKHEYFRCCTGVEGMFRNSYNLKTINITNKWNINNKPQEYYMQNCNAVIKSVM